VRGEIVLVLEVSPAAATGGELAGAPVGDIETRARAALVELEASGVRTKTAAAVVAQLTGLPARRAYELALEARGAR
jgi:16S rRNA C1402 (ribose-2'-O) methylase RsmI